MNPIPHLLLKRDKCTGGFRPPSRVGFFFLFVLALLLRAPCGNVWAQEKNPFAGDPKEAKLGEFQFRANCAFCHGLGAKGGGRGPDLTRAQKKHGNADADLYQTINDGVPGTAMPQNGATQQGVGMTPDEIWHLVDYIQQLPFEPINQPPQATPFSGQAQL